MKALDKLKIPVMLCDNNREKINLIRPAIEDIAHVAILATSYGQGVKSIPFLGEYGIRAVLMDGSLCKSDSQNKIRQGDELAQSIRGLYGDSISIISISRSRTVKSSDADWDGDPIHVRDWLEGLPSFVGAYV